MQHFKPSLSAIFLTLLGLSQVANGQGIITGGISGTVTDQSGAIVSAATVQAVSEATGSTLQTKANGEGVFRFAGVPLGTYTVSINASGFGPVTVSHVRVVAGNVTDIGTQSLKPGSATAMVEVKAGGADALLNTVSSEVTTTVDAAQVESAPITGALDNLAMMAPGVVNTHANGFSNTNGANFSVNGQRGRSNNSEIDGQTNNDTSIGGPSFFFDNQDAIQEVQVVSSSMSAQYGRNMGSVINYITKAGGNSFHGSGFEIFTGSWLSSLMQYQKGPQFGFCPAGVSPTTGCTAPTVPRFVQNNWGGTLGGPILKDKLFFFGSTLWSHTYESGVVVTSGGGLFPDANGLAQLKSAFPNNPGVSALVLSGPYSSSVGNPATVPGTASTVSVTDGTTVSNVEVAQYQRTIPNTVFDQEHLGRIDYVMTPNDRFYLRYNYQNNPYSAALYLNNNVVNAGGGYPAVNGISHEVGGDWTHIFGASVVNQLRYAFQQSKIGFEGGAVPNCTFANFGPCASNVTLGAPFSQYGYGSNEPQGRFVKVNQFQDNVNWNLGRHAIKFGTEVDYQDSPWQYLPNSSGVFNFTPGAATYSSGPNAGQTIPLRMPTGASPTETSLLTNGLTGILEGVSQTNLAIGSPTIPFKETDFAFYFQDDWKVRSDLTLNLGLRYEFFGQAANFLHSETVKQQTGPNPFWDTSLPLSATTVPMVSSFYGNVEPRIGLAYSPRFASKMVIHAGYGINVDPEYYELFINLATAAPVVDSGTFGCDGITVQCLPSGGLTFSTVQAANAKFLPRGGDPRVYPTQNFPTNIRNPMTETYVLGFQYQVAPSAVATVNYVGSHTFRQFQALNTNPNILAVQSGFPSYGAGEPVCLTTTAPGYGRPNCANSEVETYSNTAFAIYNALQTSLTLRSFRNWTGTASYTYSRAIDNVSDFASTGSGGTTSAFAQNPLDPNIGERGVSGNSYPNIWGIQLTYDEPWFANEHGILGRLLGGYYLNTFYQYNGGQPFNPIQNSYSALSSKVLSAISANPNINPTQAEFGYCDVGFSQAFSYNPCRPVLSNPSAPLSSIGINLGPGGYVDYVTGNPTTRSSEHWIWSNQYEAAALNNPFPGVGRNVLRGAGFNDVDLSLGKTIRIAESLSMKLQVSVFNVLNRAYYGTPDPNVEDSSFGGFLSHQFAFNTGLGSAAGGGSYPQGLGNRNVQLTGKITF